MKLDAILNTIAVPLEVDDTEFNLTPFPVARVGVWNRATHGSMPKDATNDEILDATERTHKAQLDIIAGHMRACLTKGDAKKVTPKWIGETFPQPVLQDLAVFFTTGERPAWAGESGN